jgi:hypothetical protein
VQIASRRTIKVSFIDHFECAVKRYKKRHLTALKIFIVTLHSKRGTKKEKYFFFKKKKGTHKKLCVYFNEAIQLERGGPCLRFSKAFA